MSGQAATAGIQERMAASQAYNDAIARQRAMELQQALGSRQNATSRVRRHHAGQVVPRQVGQRDHRRHRAADEVAHADLR
jgi:hypothetical protein